MPRLNEWNESLEETIARSQAQGGLLAYSLALDEELELSIVGETRDGLQIEEDRTFRAACTVPAVGKLHVLDDTAERNSWKGQDVCLGSYVFSLGGIELTRGGLLRGMIAQRQGVAIDFTAQNFTTQPPHYLLAEYRTLSLQDQRIF